MGGSIKLAMRPATKTEAKKGTKQVVLLETRGQKSYIACKPAEQNLRRTEVAQPCHPRMHLGKARWVTKFDMTVLYTQVHFFLDISDIFKVECRTLLYECFTSEQQAVS